MKTLSKKNITLFFLWIFLFFLVSVCLYTLINFNGELNKRYTLSNSIKENETRLISLEKRMLEDNFNMLIGDMLTLTDIAEETINNNANKDEALEQLEKYFSYIIKNKKNYDQLRLLDIGGNELARVDYKDNNAKIIHSPFLQNKKGRYYFEDASNLEKGQVYISKLDLNVESGKIEEPRKPVIRLATKIFDDEGKAYGIIVANYYAEIMISNFKDIAKNSYGYVHLINSEGYWISNDENPNSEFAFMYDDMKDVKFENAHPNKWKPIFLLGEHIDENDKYYSQEIIPFDNINKREFLIDKENIIFAGGNFISIVHISRDKVPKAFMINIWQYIIEKMFKDKMLFLSFLVFSILFSSMIMLYNIQKDKIKYYSQYDLLTTTYNRRTGIDKIMRIVKETRHRNAIIAIIFVDINGLKTVNDSLGHKYGDMLIKKTASLISGTIRNHDILFRYGGDEFVICLKNIREDIIDVVWQRIKARIDIENENSDTPFNISLSHGVSIIYPEAEVNDIKMYISEADKNMYEEKQEVKKTAVILK